MFESFSCLFIEIRIRYSLVIFKDKLLFASIVLTVRGTLVYVLLEHGYRPAVDVPNIRAREADQ